jgi:putative phosphonate metabolism protein
MDEPRFAIYFVPPAESPLYRFGASFIGYDCYTGEDLEPPDVGLDIAEWTELTQAPRTYGFHATLKAPFHLAPRASEDDLLTQFHKLAATPRAIPVLDPVVRSLGQFVAVVPGTANPAIDLLAADCVAAFDRFRRPLEARERQIRLGAGLSRRQIEHLDRWGYPYVLEDFRFHMTLTGAVAANRRGEILALLQARFDEMVGNAPLPIGQLALLRQDTPAARFRAVCTAALGPRRLGKQQSARFTGGGG